MSEACWYRIFGKRADIPDLARLRAVYRLAANEDGWYHAEFPLLWGEIELNRWLPKDDGIRAELNTWAAWVEAHVPPEHEWLIQHVAMSQQMITWSIDSTAVDAAAFSSYLCRFLCGATAGIYQVDGVGFLKADGTLLIQEEL